jgi:hypothetical protein
MPVLIGAVVVVGVLCLIDLLLTFGVIRRLREHTAMLARFQPGGDQVAGLTAGGTPEAFTATDNEGAVVQGRLGSAWLPSSRRRARCARSECLPLSTTCASIL